MSFYSESLTLREKTFVLLRDLIHERYGIYFEEGKEQALADKLSGLVLERGFDSFLDYYYLLKYDEAGEREWRRVMDALSVGETFFYREVDQIRAVVDTLVPGLAAERPGDPLFIWSAACASGEEPLSLAMALTEAGWFDRHAIRIVATDASDRAIARAREGIYRDWSFRNLPPELTEKYFEEAPGGRKISPSLKERVLYKRLNLMDRESVAEAAKSPIIFCRNVFIYFSAEAIRKVAASFYERMPNPAYLFISSSESLLRIFPAFQLETVGKAFVYVKKLC